MKRFLIFLFMANTAWAVYIPPIGIPAPSFGIDQVVTMYSGQTYTFSDGRGTIPYPNAGNGPYTHYIDKNAAGATDTANTYGTPALPRLKIPTVLTQGSVVEVHGGIYQPSKLTSVTGTFAKPVFIRGLSSDSEGDTGHNPFVWDNDWKMTNVSYLIIENGKSITPAFDNGTQIQNGSNLWSQLEIFSPSDHFVIRNCEFTNHGDLTTDTRAAGNLNLGWGDGTWVTGQETRDVVIYKCWIHDNISAPDLENGLQGMIFNRGLTNGWALENNIYNQGEDGIHVLGNPGRGDSYAWNIYIGKNRIHDCSENAIDVKQCHYTVVSENEFYNFKNFVVPTGGSDGAAIVLNEDGVIADNGPAWVLNNLIHNAAVGVRTQKPADIYFIGNIFYDIAHDPATPRGKSVTTATGDAIYLSNGLSYHVINNTAFRCDGGIYLNSMNNPDPTHDSAVVTVWNNIVLDIRGEPTLLDPNPALSYHIGLNNPKTDPLNGKLFYTFDVKNNALFQSIGTVYNHGNWTNINGFIADPLVIDKNAFNFGLQSSSPAKDAGIVSDVYALFFSQTGFNLSKDRAGTVRPQNAIWDIGAYEYVAGGTPTPTPTPTPPVQLDTTVSRMIHGGAGTFDIALTSGTAVECRSGGANGDYQIVLTFSNNLTNVDSGSVACGSVSSSGIGQNTNQYTVNLTGQNSCNQLYNTIMLTNVDDSAANHSDTVLTSQWGLLIGDTTADKNVNSADIGQTTSESGNPVTILNFRQDVTVDGNINSADIGLVKSRSGTALP